MDIDGVFFLSLLDIVHQGLSLYYYLNISFPQLASHSTFVVSKITEGSPKWLERRVDTKSIEMRDLLTGALS